MTLTELNALSDADFVAALAPIFEDSPEVGEAVVCQRPFSTLEDLHHAMVAVVLGWDAGAQLCLIQAHPDLGTRAAMAPASLLEQAGVGLDRLSSEQYYRFQHLNQTYRQRFGFPYIVAVKRHTQKSILQDYEQRLHNDVATEQARSLSEITDIAWFRLQSLFEPKRESI